MYYEALVYVKWSYNIFINRFIVYSWTIDAIEQFFSEKDRQLFQEVTSVTSEQKPTGVNSA